MADVSDNIGSVDDNSWNAAMAKAGNRELKSRLMKDAILGAVALSSVLCFVNWPHPWVVVVGVAVVIGVAWLSEARFKSSERWPASGRSVVITGCDTGIGLKLAQHLDSLGAVVFAGCLHADGPTASKLKNGASQRLHVMQMDVTDEAQVTKCAEFVNKTLKGSGLWGLVNNAGLSMLGDIELTTMSQFSNVVNINQLGMVRVTKAFLPAIRRRKEPFTGAYCMTKYATEAFSDVLRLEMKKFNVAVSIIEPGNFGGATESINMTRISGEFDEMWSKLSQSQQSDYGRAYLDYHVSFADSTRPFSCFNLMPVMDAIAHALFAVKSKTRYLVPGGCGRYDPYRWKILVQPYLPTWMMDWLLMRGYFHFPQPAVIQTSALAD